LQYYLAGAAQYAGDTEAALVAAQRATELRSDSPRFASRKPWILYQAKRPDQAEQQYRELIKKYDSSYDISGVRDVLRESRLILSNISVDRQQFPQAEEWLAQVLDEFPEDVGAKNDLGYLWADQGKHLHRATKMIQEAVEAEPDNVAYRDSLGWAYYRLGRFADAVRELQIATAGDEPDGVILDHLGDAHVGENQPDQAIVVWKKALSAFHKANQIDRLQAIEAKIKKHSQD
jgi:tetratricopeptide (TPR) repeat protein